MQSLTNREIQIIKYSAAGYTAKEIAKIVGLTPRTIEIYMGNLKRKLQARNMSHAIFIAFHENMLTRNV